MKEYIQLLLLELSKLIGTIKVKNEEEEILKLSTKRIIDNMIYEIDNKEIFKLNFEILINNINTYKKNQKNMLYLDEMLIKYSNRYIDGIDKIDTEDEVRLASKQQQVQKLFVIVMQNNITEEDFNILVQQICIRLNDLSKFKHLIYTKLSYEFMNIENALKYNKEDQLKLHINRVKEENIDVVKEENKELYELLVLFEKINDIVPTPSENQIVLNLSHQMIKK